MVHLIKKQVVNKGNILLTAILLWAVFTQAQVEIGIRAGGSNYLGDSSPIFPVLKETKPSFGAFLNVHLNQKLALVANINQYTLSGNDANLSTSTASRGIAFSTSLLDGGIALQYYFKGFQKCNKSWSPYAFAGLSLMKYQTISSNYTTLLDYTGESIADVSASIPFGIGVKKVLFKSLTLGMELQCSKTFTDQLDFPSYLGNAVYKDWYMFGGLTLSYVFGKKCDEDRRVSRSKAMPCPVISKNVVGF
jgi:hypothetical protein